MGSSKKHKEKDKERDSKRKHRRSRSRSKDRDSSYRNKDKDRHAAKSRRRHRSSSDEGGDNSHARPVKHAKRSRRVSEEAVDDTPNVKSSGGEISMSIEETNKVRMKLGLKPLEDKKKKTADNETKSTTETEEIFIKTENISEKKETEKLREKIAAKKEKRRIMDKLKKVKGLAESDSDDDAISWVHKNRKIAEEKKKAEERAKLLEEMDEEFGIGNLIEEDFSKSKARLYSSRNLSGMTVGHSKTLFKEGNSVILTLKDKDVLAEDDDVLQNINLLDDELADKNILNRKKLAGYQPYEDLQYDENGELIKKELLDKYDEEIDGPKLEAFKLGSGGKVDTRKETAMRELRAKLQQKKSQSLVLPEPIIASEFYSSEEMVKFKKTKKKVRKVRKKVLRADDLEPLPESTNDHGARGSKKNADEAKRSVRKSQSGVDTNIIDMDVSALPTLPDEQTRAYNQAIPTDVILEDDQAEADLQNALNNARKLKQLANSKSGVEKVAQSIRQSRDLAIDENDAESPHIIMNETAEFCRVLGDIPTYGQSGNREDEEDLMDLEEEEIEEKPKGDESPVQGSWNEVEVSKIPLIGSEPQDEGPILEEEPIVGTGIAAALQLATQKGYLDKEIKKADISANPSHLQAKNYSIEDKNYDDDKGSGRRSDRFISGPINDFKEKDSYKPEIKLDYIDDSGHVLSQKEAFRYLSHKFHGKGPGKLKTEKRVKKQEEDALLRKMSSTDTPLKTLSMLQDKQKETQSPYVILSGGSKALQSNSLSKTK